MRDHPWHGVHILAGMWGLKLYQTNRASSASKQNV